MNRYEQYLHTTGKRIGQLLQLKEVEIGERWAHQDRLETVYVKTEKNAGRAGFSDVLFSYRLGQHPDNLYSTHMNVEVILVA